MRTSEQVSKAATALAIAQGACDRHAESDAIFALSRLFRRRGYVAARPYITCFSRISYGLSDCWYWVGLRSWLGYGQIAAARNYGSCEIAAHRLSWELFNGPVPTGLKVLHRCDVRACVNPSHLFLGSQADNVADMIAKGRGRSIPMYGEANPGARLTTDQVRAIRAAHASGETQHGLARRFGVAPMTVNRIVRHQTWRME